MIGSVVQSVLDATLDAGIENAPSDYSDDEEHEDCRIRRYSFQSAVELQIQQGFFRTRATYLAHSTDVSNKILLRDLH